MGVDPPCFAVCVALSSAGEPVVLGEALGFCGGDASLKLLRRRRRRGAQGGARRPAHLRRRVRRHREGRPLRGPPSFLSLLFPLLLLLLLLFIYHFLCMLASHQMNIWMIGYCIYI